LSTVFWDIMPYSPLKARRFGGTYRLHFQGRRTSRARCQCELRLPRAFTLVSCTAYSIMKMEVICSSETSVDFWRATRRSIPEDSIHHIRCCENLSSYTGDVGVLQHCAKTARDSGVALCVIITKNAEAPSLITAYHTYYGLSLAVTSPPDYATYPSSSTNRNYMRFTNPRICSLNGVFKLTLWCKKFVQIILLN
jgi:hypothetical protein